MDFEALQANYKPMNLSAPAKGAQKANKKKANLLTNLMPTIGGTAGGVGGGAIGGALAGSAILPGVGTAVGGLLGALLGGSTGGAVGKIAENKLEGNSLGNGLKGAALTEGVMSAGPIRLLKGAATAGKVVKNGGGLGAALGEGGAVNATIAAPSAFKTAMAGKLDNTADGLAQRGMKMNESGFGTKFADRSGEEVGQALRRYKIPQLGVAGAKDSVLQPGFAAHAAAVESIGTISKADVYKSVQEKVAKELSSKVPASQAFAKDVLKEAKGVLDNFGDNISASELNAVKSEIAGRVNHAATDSASRNTNEVLNRVSGAFRGSINSAADKAGITASPELAKLGYKSSKVGDLGEEVKNLSDLLEQANKKSRVGSGSSPVGLIPSVLAGGVGGPGGLAAGAGAQVINSNAGRSALAKGADKLANRAAGKAEAAMAANPFGAKAIAKRTVPVGLAGALMQGGEIQSSSNDQMLTDMTMNASTNNMDLLSQLPDENASAIPEADPNDPFNPANAQAQIQQILANGGDMDDVKDYLGIVSTMQELQAASLPATAKPLSAAAQKQAETANSGMSSLAQIESIINSGGVPKGTVLPGRGAFGGLLGNATGTAAYDAAANNVADTMVRMRTGAAATKEELALYRQLLPQAFDSPEVQRQKMQAVRTYLGNLSTSQGGETAPDDLLSALSR